MDDGPCAKITGILRCGHIHTCPVCSAKLRAERAALIRRAIDGSGLRWRMLTVTAGHQRLDSLRKLYTGLTIAWRKTRQGGAVQALWTKNVRASVRATEVRWSRANGWHVHFHVLLAGSNWKQRERAVLFQRWRKAVVDQLGEDHAPQQGVPWVDAKGRRRTFDSVYWSTAHDALPEYVAKLGMEVSGYKKESAYSLSPWDIARLAADGDKEMLALWHEYQVETSGRRAIELDDRARAFASKQDDLDALSEEHHTAPLAAETREREREVVLYPDEVLALRRGERVSPGYAWHLVRAVEMDPEHAEETIKRATVFAFEHGGSAGELARYLGNFGREMTFEVGGPCDVVTLRPLPGGPASLVTFYARTERPVRPAPPARALVALAPPTGPPHNDVVSLATERMKAERARWLASLVRAAEVE